MKTLNLTFNDCLEKILEYEGGFTIDDGGPTMKGITQSEYDLYLHSHRLPVANVENITDQQVSDIYKNSYWILTHCQGLPSPLNLINFNCAVNQGTGRANININRVFGVDQNLPIWTAHTSYVAHNIHQLEADCIAYLKLNKEFYEAITNQNPAKYQRYLAGWLNRVNELADFCGLEI